jgi:hypothetical protein
MNAAAPILKIRAALRERAKSPAMNAANVVSVTDNLMLDWSEREVAVRKSARELLAGVGDDLADLKQLITGVLTGEKEISPLEKLLVFTKLESANGLAKQAFNMLALASLAIVICGALAPDDDRSAMLRAPRGVRVVRTVRVLRGRNEVEGLAA